MGGHTGPPLQNLGSDVGADLCVRPSAAGSQRFHLNQVVLSLEPLLRRNNADIADLVHVMLNLDAVQ